MTLRGPDNPLRDPGITIGRYRILERTDGLWILYDDRLPKDGSVAWIGRSKDDAVREAERLTKLGSPVVIVNDVAPRTRATNTRTSTSRRAK